MLLQVCWKNFVSNVIVREKVERDYRVTELMKQRKLKLLVVCVCHSGVQLTNPFYSIWATTSGRNLGVSFADDDDDDDN